LAETRGFLARAGRAHCRRADAEPAYQARFFTYHSKNSGWHSEPGPQPLV